ncbi:hypothetical protein [Granulicella arctica]|uniref:hypothetical protein n=1 Tax=Granulicella arctica TaxID=940613 RepID=UPI0021E073B8|nr:hypothetical protein [Granulicella arctica]
MRLWSEYEGTTIAEAYPIEKLIRPEGRSAFFSTSNGTGTPAVIRLIESINDESEILSRWKTVADLKDAHLITLKKFGQTIFEGTPLIYVLMETSEADLSGILKERTLTTEETREIATSLVGALQTLHASDIVHEHVEPSNVMATGEEVKLRSDCIREAPEGEEGLAARKQDVHDLAVVLLQALTNRKSLDGIDGKRLPAPFDQIIRNGMSGGWGLAQIAAALNPPVAKPPVTPAVRTPMVTTAATAGTAQAQQIPLAIPRATEQTAWSGKRPEPTKETTGVQAAAPVLERPVMQRDRITVPVVDEETRRRRLWIAIAPVVIVVAAALGWHFFHKAAAPTESSQPITTLSEVAPPNAAPAAPPTVTKAPQADTSAPVTPVAADAQHPWRVVAYTYNRQDQAQHKADTIAQHDAALRPEVFRPSGTGSFMVTVGGAMTRDEAVAFRQKAQSEGLPRDIYIQNYESREQRRARRGR